MKPVVHFKFFSKRNIKKNIISCMKGIRLKKKGILFLLGMILLTAPCGLSSCSQQKDVSQRRIEKEKARKDKESRKSMNRPSSNMRKTNRPRPVQ